MLIEQLKVGAKEKSAVGLAAIVMAIWVTASHWLDPAQRVNGVNAGDQALFEWLLSYGIYAITHGSDPFFTNLLNVPDGVNLAVNTSITVYAVVFAPFTLLLGAPTTYVIILTFNLAATAFGWYWLLRRHLAVPAFGAFVGGMFCGFAPAMISHANAHLNWTAQWLIPLIVARVLLLHRRDRPVKDGIILGLLVAACFSIAAEALFFAALAIGVFTISWALITKTRPSVKFLSGLGICTVVAGVLLVYPLWMHFFGRQSFHGTGFDQRLHSADLAAYGSWPERSLAGAADVNLYLAPNLSEENSNFGIPLLLLAIFGLVRLWRYASVRALAITGLVFIILSLGPRLRFMGKPTDIPLPWTLLADLPIFDAALPGRLALVIAPIVGIVLAHLCGARPDKLLVVAGLVALLPLAPLPILADDREPVPRFFTSGQWKSYVDSGGVVLPVPLPSDLAPDGQRWQASVLADAAKSKDGRVFRVPAGFFLGPGGPDGTGRIGPVPRPTAVLLEDAAKHGTVPAISDREREQALEDLRFWGVQLIVLADNVQAAHYELHRAELLLVLTDLFGQPQRVDDVQIWGI